MEAAETTTPATVPAAEAVPAWRDILAREIALHPRGKAGVAERLGVCRSYVARAMSGGTSAYAAVPAKFVRRVMELESDVDCPSSGDRRPRADCHKANAAAPTHNPLAMRLWRDCQACPIKPLSPKEE